MPYGDNGVYISYEAVRQALSALRHHSRKSPNPLQPLEQTSLVDEYLLKNPSLPETEYLRQFALADILSQIIENQLNNLRRTLNLTPQQEDTREQAALNIQNDAVVQSDDLTGWSILYYRYVRVDFNITPDDYSAWAGFDVRTFRRYQKHGIFRLTETLYHEEHAIRRHRLKRRLQAVLPHVTPSRLYEREEDISRALDCLVLNDNHFPHVHVVGEQGIGKTAFISAVINQLIEKGTIDTLIWLDTPHTLTEIRTHIYERLVPAGVASLSIPECLLIRRTAIVLENIDAVLSDELERQRFNLFLQQLSAAYVLISSQVKIPLPNVATAFSLKPLSFAATQSYLADLLTARYGYTDDELLNAYLHKIWPHTKGNPLKTRLAFFASLLEEDATISDFDNLTGHLFARLTPSQQRCCFIWALFAESVPDNEDLRYLWPTVVNQNNLEVLNQIGLLEKLHQQGYQLSSAVLSYLKQHYPRSRTLQQIAEELLQAIDSNLQNPPKVIRTIEHILNARWLNIHPHREQKWLRSMWRYALKHRSHALWRQFFATYLAHTPNDVTIRRAFAICLRRLGEWYEAEQELHRTMAYAGEVGDFTAQTSTILELGILAKLRGQFTRAHEYLADAASRAKHYADEKTYIHAQVELAQLALETEDPDTAEELLKSITTDRATLLRAEALCAKGDIERGIRMAKALATHFYVTNQQQELAATYALLGKVYYQLGKINAAHRYCTLAYQLYNQMDNPFWLARAKTNLAACLIALNDISTARNFLRDAASIQRTLGDKLGLELTLHNLRLTDHRQAQSP